jgi:hypothetical protein
MPLQGIALAQRFVTLPSLGIACATRCPTPHCQGGTLPNIALAKLGFAEALRDVAMPCRSDAMPYHADATRRQALPSRNHT